ncbi:MAG TPA: TylF/MycF/NovP-related O-methyltransferase [Pirellulales bacterium]|nr:TylF/MycF/NovP-related O-methyltransferase [Pirellulales bacterium]
MDNPVIQFNRHYLVRYFEDSHFMRLYSEGMTRANSQGRDSFEKQCRYYGMYQMLRRVLERNVPGDIIECGCWRGHSSFMISKLIAESGQKRTFHIFDSFEGGLSDRTTEDSGLFAPQSAEAVKQQKQAFYSTEEEVRSTLAPFDFYKLYPGWIPDRFPEVAERSIALVNIDVDLYQPIRDSLRFFYPRLSPGGVIVVDDYGTTDWPGATKAVDEFLKENDVTFSIETLGSMVIVNNG